MTDTTTPTSARLSWLTHPILAWRAYQAALADRTDAEAVTAGLTAQVLPNGVRRYRDPRLDSLAEHRTQHTALDDDDRRFADAANTAAWSTPTLVTARAWSR
jgi:hypothetical protein